MKDPVHEVLEPEDEDGRTCEPGWYFWDETRSTRHGPHPTYEAATEAYEQHQELLACARRLR